MTPHYDYEQLAAAMVRANALLGNPTDDDQAEVDAAAEALKGAGLEGGLTRVLDDTGVVRWHLRIDTERGRIDRELDDPSDWKRELEELGLV